eukprot:365193-Chlamydomonas_euryale.AAC.1
MPLLVLLAAPCVKQLKKSSGVAMAGLLRLLCALAGRDGRDGTSRNKRRQKSLKDVALKKTARNR